MDLRTSVARVSMGAVRGGVSLSPVEEGSGEGAVPPPQKIFVILLYKCCIFMQFGVGIFTLKGV